MRSKVVANFGTAEGILVNMKLCLFLACLAALAAVCLGGLQIGVKKRPETCDMRSKKGDKLSMHYTVSTNRLQVVDVLCVLVCVG